MQQLFAFTFPLNALQVPPTRMHLLAQVPEVQALFPQQSCSLVHPFLFGSMHGPIRGAMGAAMGVIEDPVGEVGAPLASGGASVEGGGAVGSGDDMLGGTAGFSAGAAGLGLGLGLGGLEPGSVHKVCGFSNSPSPVYSALQYSVYACGILCM